MLCCDEQSEEEKVERRIEEDKYAWKMRIEALTAQLSEQRQHQSTGREEKQSNIEVSDCNLI